MMNNKLLEGIGLTEGEVKVYFALIKLGLTKTGELAKEAGVSSSKVYKILDRLEKKGIVGHILKGEIKYFSANNPKRIINYIEEKEKDLKGKKEEILKLIPQLDSEMNKTNKNSEATIYEGFKGATNLFREMIDELKKGDKYYVIGASYGEVTGLRDFFHNHHLRRAEKGIKVMMLANEEVRGNIEPSTKRNAEIKYLPNFLATKMEIVIYKDKSFLILWTKEPIAFAIQNEEATKSFKIYFDTFWKIAKK